MTLAMGAPIRAGAASTSLQINFGSTPHWTTVRGTRVDEIRDGERPNFDMYRYGGNYYVYNNDRGYASNQDRGRFNLLDDRSIPSDFAMIPRDHWRNYPSSWANRDAYRQYPGSQGASASQRFDFGKQPRWSSIRGTRVQMITTNRYPDYDMFRYDGTYYVYDNNQ